MCIYGLQADAPTLEQTMAAMAVDAPTTRDGTPVQQKIAAADSSISKALNCQAFIISLFSKGREVYAHAQD